MGFCVRLVCNAVKRLASRGHKASIGVVYTGVGRHGDRTLAGGDRVKQIVSMDTVCASFSNRGVTVALTAPGVAVVSTFLAIGGG